MQPRALLWIVPLALTAGGCSESVSGPHIDGPRFSIEDAVHNSGNQHFYWLAPIVATPTFGGTFDESLSPVVSICEWLGTECAQPLVALFTTTTGPGSETVRVVAADQQYVANWHTDEFGLDPAKTYRIAVSVDDQQLGHADVDVVSGGNQLKNVDTNEYIALKDGRTLPIKFRIEEGAISTDPCAVISFGDANLEAYVRSITGIPSGPITGGDVAGVESLDFLFAPGPVTSLEGLQCFTGLTALNTRTGSVSDLTPIAGLVSLTGLSIAAMPVSDLTPLSGLTNLTFLSISATQVGDLTPLASLTNMVILTMFGLPGVTDLGPLAGMTRLERLDVRGSPIAGTESSLAGLTAMTHLTLTGAGIADLSFTSGMASLTAADLRGNQLADLTPLSGLPLTFLNIDGNLVTDLTPIGSLTGLTSLSLLDNPGVASIAPLANLTNLTRLWMRQVNVGSQASVLQNLIQLTDIRIDNASLTDLTFASSLSLLRSVSVRGNSIIDASPLLGLSSLVALDITANPLTCSDPVLAQLELNGTSVYANFTGGGSGAC